jgi:predicted Zn-dependent protease
MHYYEAALALNPANITANRRLGQIEISLGEYDAACDHVRQAYQSAPGQRATRQLMGECYAIVGDRVDAAELWRTIDISQGQITLRQFWYDYLGDTQRSDWVGQAAALLQSP